MRAAATSLPRFRGCTKTRSAPSTPSLPPPPSPPPSTPPAATRRWPPPSRPAPPAACASVAASRGGDGGGMGTNSAAAAAADPVRHALPTPADAAQDRIPADAYVEDGRDRGPKTSVTVVTSAVDERDGARHDAHAVGRVRGGRRGGREGDRGGIGAHDDRYAPICRHRRANDLGRDWAGGRSKVRLTRRASGSSVFDWSTMRALVRIESWK